MMPILPEKLMLQKDLSTNRWAGLDKAPEFHEVVILISAA